MDETQVIRGNERVYPCRCGVEHTGPYREEDWRHHNCFHDGEWVTVGGICTTPEKQQVIQCMCMDCGLSIVAVMAPELNNFNRSSLQ